MNALTFIEHRFKCCLLSIVMIMVSASHVSFATTITATATGSLTTTVPQFSYSQPDEHIVTALGNATQPEPDNENKDFSTWTFDFASDPNFTSLQNSNSLKSAILTLTLNPTQIHINQDSGKSSNLSTNGSPAHQRLAVHATTRIEVELLDIYSAQDIIDMFKAPSIELPIALPDPSAISSVKLHVTTDTPTTGTSGMVMTLVLLVIAGMLGYVGWQRRKKRLPAQAIEVSDVSEPATHPIHEDRMAMVGKMASSVIHDVKNSFTAIRSCAEVIADEELDPHDRKDFAQLIVSEIERGVGMTQELLEFSRGKKRTLNLQPYPVDALVQATVSVIHRDFANRNITIYTDLEYKGNILIDIEKMKRVFMNIVINARDAMSEGGSLTIASRHIENIVRFEFIDTGCGMSPELQARIFEPLVTEGKPHGTGLGMTIVKDILEQHHADIDIKSVITQGTTIRISLPQEC